MSTIHLDYSGVRCYNSLDGDESTMKMVVNIVEETFAVNTTKHTKYI
jgi:hypothetical protein